MWGIFFLFGSQELNFFSKKWEYFDKIFPFYFTFFIVMKFHIKKKTYDTHHWFTLQVTLAKPKVEPIDDNLSYPGKNLKQ
jgi:hypothetical protein